MGKSILNEKSIKFLETYLNNPSPTGYEWEGQKIWMDYPVLLIQNQILRL